jgi:hypothetical protein
MEEKKIATSVDILVNVDKFEHVQITKYSEKKISYSSKEDMIKQEDQLTAELVEDLLRTMRGIGPQVGGKVTTAVTKMEDKIQKKMPTWLEEGKEPNIANLAKVKAEGSIAKANADIENNKALQQAKEEETNAFLSDKPKVVEAPKSEAKVEVEIKSEAKVETKKDDILNLEADDDLFSDDDLFK